MFPSSFFYEVVTLYVVLDPIAAVPIFLAATKGLDQRARIKVAAYGVAVAFLIFLFSFLLVMRCLRRFTSP